MLTVASDAVGRSVRCDLCARDYVLVKKNKAPTIHAEPEISRLHRKRDLATLFAWLALLPIVAAALAFGLELSRRERRTEVALPAFARPVDLPPAARYAFDFDEPMPPLPGPAQVRSMRDEVLRYLEKKCGAQPAAEFTAGVYAAGACVEAYDSVNHNHSSPPARSQAHYRLVYSHLLGAEKLLQSSDPQRRLDGLDVLRETALCSVERLNDDWLGPRICHAFLVPNLRHASTESYDRLSTANLISTCIYVFGEAKSQQDLLIGYRLLLHLASEPNTREATRLRLANELAAQGDYGEAIRYLKGIQPDGPIGGAHALIANLENKLTRNNDAKKNGK